MKATRDVVLADDLRSVSAFFSKEFSYVDVCKQVHLDDTVLCVGPACHIFLFCFCFDLDPDQARIFGVDREEN
jgi:hypothetical protein